MKFIILMVVSSFFNSGYGQQVSCNKVNDTLLIFNVEIVKAKTPTQQFWCTAKQFKASSSIDTKSIDSFVKTFIRDKNYCPYLPDGYREELFKCFGDSAVNYITKTERNNGNVYKLLDEVKKRSYKTEFVLADGNMVRLSITKRYGSFLIRNIEKDILGTNSDEYGIDKRQLNNKVVFIPLETYPVGLIMH